jgi:hypothetical protein
MIDHDESPCKAVIRFDEVLMQLRIIRDDGRSCYFNSGEEMSYYACLTLRGSNANI